MKKYLYIIPLSFLLLACSSNESNIQNSTTSSTTITLPEKPVVIAAVGDISCSTSQRKDNPSDCQDQAVAQLIESKQPNHIFLLGDIQYNSGSDTEYLYNFNPIWGHLVPKIKAIIGNHDLNESSAAFYTYFFEVPKPGYYSFDLSNDWRVFALNTNDECKYLKCDKNSDQYKWLEQQLQSSQDKCKILIQHHSRYSSGVHGQNYSVDDLDQLAQQYNVSIVLAAHDHHYERFNTNPVRYVVGTGGKELRSVKTPIKNSSFILDQKYGSLFLEIYSNYFNAYFLDTDNIVYDYQTIFCNKQ